MLASVGAELVGLSIVLTIHFGKPEHGWMDVHAVVDGEAIEHCVSDVPCDSIQLLLSALVLLCEGSKAERVDWSLEPNYWNWLFAVKGDQMKLSMTCGNMQLDYCDSAKMVIQTMFDAICSLRNYGVWQRQDAGKGYWSWPFPESSYHRLKASFAKFE